MRFSAGSKLWPRIIRNHTNEVYKPWRNWWGYGISLVKECIQFWCVNEVCEDRSKTMLKVLDSLVKKGVVPTSWFKWEWSYVHTLSVTLGWMCDQVKKCIPNQVWGNSSTRYPIITPEITRFNAPPQIQSWLYHLVVHSLEEKTPTMYGR